MTCVSLCVCVCVCVLLRVGVKVVGFDGKLKYVIRRLRGLAQFSDLVNL